MSRKPPFEVARNFLKEKFPDFEVAFVAGSFNRGEETATSDIDLVVVMPLVEQAWRQSLIFDGWPIEVFLHDQETIKYFFYEVDAKEGIPTLPDMVLNGPTVPENHPTGIKLKELAKKVITQGPPVWPDDDKRNFRYMISDLLDDLKAPRNKFEGLAIAAKLHGMLSFFLFRTNGNWGAGGKHIPRHLQKTYPDLFPTWENAFTSAFSGDFSKVVQLTERILSENGGYLFEGYKRMAPKEWRKS